MKKSALFSALGIGLLSINLAFATPAEAVNQVRTSATQVLNILKEANGSNDAAVRRKAESYALPRHPDLDTPLSSLRTSPIKNPLGGPLPYTLGPLVNFDRAFF